MSAGEYCNRDVVVVAKAESVREAINLMRSYHVGTVVVVEEQGATPVPVGAISLPGCGTRCSEAGNP